MTPRPKPTLQIDFTLTSYTSETQRARVVLETWAKLNLWCNSCGSPTLLSLPPNTPVSDLRCATCRLEYQVKSQSHPFRKTIKGAKYDPSYERALDKDMPDYVLVQYDRLLEQVIRVEIVRGHELTPDRIIKRRALRAGARREDWIGFNVNIEGVTRVPIVAPAFLPRV